MKKSSFLFWYYYFFQSVTFSETCTPLIQLKHAVKDENSGIRVLDNFIYARREPIYFWYFTDFYIHRIYQFSGNTIGKCNKEYYLRCTRGSVVVLSVVVVLGFGCIGTVLCILSLCLLRYYYKNNSLQTSQEWTYSCVLFALGVDHSVLPI